MKIYTKLSLLKILKITGFISYSHADGVDLTLGLSEYVEHLISDFNLIYDEHIDKGEKLEKIIEKLSVRDIDNCHNVSSFDKFC